MAAIGRVIAMVLAALAVGIVPAKGSERVDVDAGHVRLAVNSAGKALVTYRARGRTIHLLVWGAVNALPPSQTVRQVHFRFDWSGGWENSPPLRLEEVQEPRRQARGTGARLLPGARPGVRRGALA